MGIVNTLPGISQRTLLEAVAAPSFTRPQTRWNFLQTAPEPGPSYRDRDGFRLIEITLREPRQLFNNLDPAPFHEKDLEASAEDYIVTAVREIGLTRPTKLAIYLPAAALLSDDAQNVPAAIHNYFAYREQHTRRELHDLLRTGLIILVIGLVFLFACLWARGAARAFAAPWAAILNEGLLIMGWVAMWRPINVFLYDWWPVRQRQKTFARVAVIPVELHQHE